MDGRGTALPYLAGMNTIIEFQVFHQKASRLLTEPELDELICFIASNPYSGVVIPGSGGIRKLRWSRQGTGKRSGVRVVYYNKTRTETWLLAIYAKSEKESLSVNALLRMKESIDG